MRKISSSREPGAGTFLALGVVALILNIAVLVGVVAVLVVVLRALGVIS